MPGGRPLKFPDVEELQRKIDDYFEQCDDDEKPYTITGLALALDTSRETLLDYEKKDGFSDTIKTAKLRVQHYIECLSLSAKNPAGSIFNMKCNFGYQDKIVVDASVEVTGELDVRLNDAKRRLRESQDNDSL
jgi:hypothetical protein